MDLMLLVSAVGQLNRPRFPREIEGFGSFTGIAYHSAEWRHDVDLTGKRVVCIGTGASALQFLPHVAEHAEHFLGRFPPAAHRGDDEFHKALGAGLGFAAGALRGFRSARGGG